jgi:UDP-N-acetylmuramoyl-L-alanyl-D-glutamate--2,6-diaminopimelate ligase
VSRRDPAAEVHAKTVHFHREGISVEVASPLGDLELESPLLGAHNLENLLVAVGMGIACGEDRPFLDALGTIGAAAGRLEPVEHPGGVRIVVDYAHTPDALRMAIEALRPFTPGRLLVVFGCGGDRDRGKRPQMGEIAARSADVVIITSDNPRTEPPASILEAIEEGARAGGAAPLGGSSERGYVVIEERAEAISRAIDLASRGDTVLIAGKGHETVQIVGDARLPFDDREVARAHVERSARG